MSVPSVLSCIDGSTYSHSIAEYAAWAANTLGAPLTFLHTLERRQLPVVADLSGSIGLGASESLLSDMTAVEQQRSRLMREKGQVMLDEADQCAREMGVENIELLQRHGALTESLIDLEEVIRLLIVGIRGEQHADDPKGIGHQLESMIRALHKPILVVNQDFVAPQKIMLAYDGGEAAEKALQMVSSSALFSHCECHLVHVVDGHAASADDPILEHGMAKLKAAGLRPKCEKLSGKIDEVLAAYQQQNAIDLMVMGAFSHTRIRGFLLGSFTAKMLQVTQKPLLLLR